MSRPTVFLTAHWKNLVMLNYEVEAPLLVPFLPAGTELDLWNGQALVSLVGFQFQKTRIKGWTIPGHQDFVEVNLRFYVRRQTAEGWQRGVVFLKEIVARPVVSWVANTIYHESYVTLPMCHEIRLPDATNGHCGRAAYRWRLDRDEFEIRADFRGQPQPFAPDSEDEFIAEHYWGYTKQPNGSTMQYQVDHPQWKTWRIDHAEFRGDARSLYGPALASVLRQPLRSALVAEGSAVTVYSGERLKFVDSTQTVPIYRIGPAIGLIQVPDDGDRSQSKAS